MKDDIEPILRTDLITVAKAYAKAMDLSLSTASRRLHGDPGFIASLERRPKPAGFTPRKYDEFILKAKKIWPYDQADFPTIHGPSIASSSRSAK